jgi:hypothetical protein
VQVRADSADDDTLWWHLREGLPNAPRFPCHLKYVQTQQRLLTTRAFVDMSISNLGGDCWGMFIVRASDPHRREVVFDARTPRMMDGIQLINGAFELNPLEDSQLDRRNAIDESSLPRILDALRPRDMLITVMGGEDFFEVIATKVEREGEGKEKGA